MAQLAGWSPLLSRQARSPSQLLLPTPSHRQGRRSMVSSRPGRRAGLACAAQLRPFGGTGGPPEAPARQQPPAAVASQAQAVDVAPPVPEQAHDLAALLRRLGGAATYRDKMAILRTLPAVQAFLRNTREGRLVSRELDDLPPKDSFCLLLLPAIHQQHVLSLIPTSVPISNALAQLATALARVEDFYDSIGGLAGYQLQCLTLIAQERGLDAPPAAHTSHPAPSGADWPSGTISGGSAGAATDYLVPAGLDLARPELAQQAAAAVAAGLAALPAMAEVYPLGGAGDRLGLRCDVSGESLPTAVLQYCGRSLLENLLRDLQAREYLFWRLHGEQHTTPVAIMTSAAKGNHWRVQQLFEDSAWFGRGESSFRLFQQPLVPMVAAEDGRWLLEQPLKVMMKPGGHGVIWKLMIDTGVFGWLASQGRQAAIVRQISNPMAGVDNTLLALAGAGFPRRRSFGFASCERVVGAAEGMNVLAQVRHSTGAPHDGAPHAKGGTGGTSGARERYSYRVTNVEYTEFERLGVVDCSVDEASNHSVFPANTNVLYVGLQAVESAVRASMAAGTTDGVLPGMILNLGKRVSWADPLAGGAERCTAAGRLECTMQNLADSLAQSFDAPLSGGEACAQLDTFLVYNHRRKVTSSAKRKRQPGSTKVHQTPDGSFYDLQHNAADMLANHCAWEVPEVGSVRQYLDHGPGFVFLAHPALGPLWQVVGQKLRGGSLAPRSELQLEVAEACLEGVHVQGSLRVLADSPLGHSEMRPAAPAGGAPAATPDGGLLHNLLRSERGSGSSSSSMSALTGFRLVNGGTPAAAAAAADADDAAGYSQPCTFPAAGCEADAALEPRLVYSERCGRVRLHNVRVANAGVDWAHPGNVWWRHSLARREACQVLLHGCSEFEARDVTLTGDRTFEVPDGHRMLVTAGPDGAPVTQLEAVDAPSWRWRYRMSPEGKVQLDLLERGATPPAAPASSSSSSA